MRNSTLRTALLCVAAFGLWGCDDDNNGGGREPVVAPPQPGALSKAINGSVVDAASGRTVDNVTVSFLRNGQPATSIVDVNGDALQTLSSSDGNFVVAQRRSSTVDRIQIAVQAPGYLPRSQTVSLAAFAEGADAVVALIPLISREADGVGDVTQTADIASGNLPAATVVDTRTDGSGGRSDAGWAVLTLPAGTDLRGPDGSLADGGQVQINVSHVERTAPDADDAILIGALSDGLSVAGGGTVRKPLAGANIEITDANGDPVTQFSQPVTIALELPADTPLPNAGRNIAEGDVLALFSYDERSGQWQNENQTVTVGPLNAGTGSHTAAFNTDHLTFFALTRSTPACTQDMVVTFDGASVPAAGLLVTETSSDASASGYVPGGATSLRLLTGDLAARYGVSAEATARVRAFDFANNSWADTVSEVPVCGTVNLTLQEPVTYVSETLNLTATCTQDTTVSVPVVAGVVRYALSGLSATTAVNLGAGAYQLSDLVQGATYNVSIAPRFSDLNGAVATQTTTISADGTSESFSIPISCATATGAAGQTR